MADIAGRDENRNVTIQGISNVDFSTRTATNVGVDPVTHEMLVKASVSITPSGTQDVNLTKIAGTATSVNNGTVDAGTIRVTVASDSTGQIKLATGANVIGSISNTTFAVTQSTSPWVVSGTTNPTTPSTLVAFVTTVTTAGTRVQLASNAVVAGILEAPSTNTGLIYVGTVTVSSTVYGAELQPGQSTGIQIDNTNKLYIDSSVNGDKCAFFGS